MAISVTFDTNTLEKAARPERATKDPERPIYDIVHQALRDDRIRGFFCETIATLEGIQKKDRAQVLGSTRIESRSTSPTPNVVNLDLQVEQDRLPLHPEMAARIEAALNIGMRVLRAPPRIGWIRMGGDDRIFHEPDFPLAERVQVSHSVASAISARSVGSAAAISLGNSFNLRDAVHAPWFHGLKRARDIHEENQVKRSIAEYADGESIAAHIGYKIEYFCTQDKGRGAGGASILDAANKAWLTASYGVRFITLSELADLL